MIKLSRTALVLAAVALLGVGGCGKKDKDDKEPAKGAPAAKADTGGKTAGGCDRRTADALCGEYFGMAKTDWVKKECEAYGGPFVEACPKEGAVLRCVMGGGTGQELHNLFYAPMTKEAATAMCAGGEVREP
jgi:hypothetical protein